jgi:hypothetical protein
MNARANNNPHLKTTWDVISFLIECTGLPHGSRLTAIHATNNGEVLDGEGRWRAIE